MKKFLTILNSTIATNVLLILFIVGGHYVTAIIDEMYREISRIETHVNDINRDTDSLERKIVSLHKNFENFTKSHNETLSQINRGINGKSGKADCTGYFCPADIRSNLHKIEQSLQKLDKIAQDVTTLRIYNSN